MIKMLRIDDRLLHGQVVFMWTKQLNIKGIIVANDELVTDPIQSLAMKLAVPEHLKLLIKTIDEAAKLINDPRAAGMNILVVMKNPIDAARLLQKIEDKSVIERVNIGNSGRIDKGDRMMMTKEVYVDDADIAAIEEILAAGLPFEIQMIPTSNKVQVKEALKKRPEIGRTVYDTGSSTSDRPGGGSRSGGGGYRRQRHG